MPKSLNILKNAFGISFLLGNAAASVSTSEADKWQYNLLNPVPRDLMREMSTDRPDKTESPYTVDAGHFQGESHIVSFGIDQRTSDGSRTFGLNVANVNLKAGLFNNVDLQVVLENYVYERTQAGGVIEQKSGYDDITTRLKINLWGNDVASRPSA